MTIRAVPLLAFAWTFAMAAVVGPCEPCAAQAASPAASSAPAASRAGDVDPAPVDPALYQALRWRLIGPFRGGRVLAVAGIPGDAVHFYFGAVDGGVWETSNAGRTWEPIFDAEPVGSIGALAIAPSDSRTLYVGTGEADMRSDIAHGDGLYKTTDDGRHWAHLGLEDTRQIGRILVDPRDANVVYVAALGHAYGPNTERGVFRSRDGGRSWSRVLYRDADTGAIDLAFRPGAPDTIYAALWQTRRRPWSVYPPSNGPGSGLYVSHDGGDHWRQIEGSGFPQHPGRIGIAVAPSTPDRLYALVDGSSAEGGLYRSDDGGAHWQHVSGDRRIWERGWYFGRLTVDPKNPDRVYVMDTIVLRSDDGGRHFIALKGDPTGDDFHELWIDPTDSDRQILGIDQGTLITLDGGKTWSSWFNQPTAQIYHVSTDNRFPYWVYGAQQDSGAVALPSRTDGSNGITMQHFRESSAGGESDMIAPDPDDPDIVYGGRVDRLDLKTQQARSVDPTLAYPQVHYRAAWTLPLAFSRRGPRVLYFANQMLFRTADGGKHWMRASPDLTRADAGVPSNLDPPTAADDDHVGGHRGVIYTIATSPLDARTLWVGTDDGLAWRTDDGGAHWRDVTPSALTPWSKVGGIELSHFDADTAYLAIDRHRLEDDAPYIYRTHDGGRTWSRIDFGIPRDSFVNVVREDPVQRELLYAGTEKGMYVSFDDGAHWQSLQQNLPMTSVRDIDVHGNDLVIATHGRGFWIMDDVTPLRQMRNAMGQAARGAPSGSSGLVLYRPAIAIRMRAGETFQGTPFPKDEPMAENPPTGAIIDYALPADAHGAVTLAVFDGGHRLVRRFSSADRAPAPDPTKLEFAPEWVPTPARLGISRGMHRFVWDLHYPAPPVLTEPSSGARQAGVWAPPGRYTIELTAEGRSAVESLEVVADPRIKLPVDALRREFELARGVERARARAMIARSEAAKLLKLIESRRTEAGAAAPELEGFARQVSEVSGLPPRSPLSPNAASPPPLRTDSLEPLIADLRALERAVDGADADPSADARTSYAQLSRTLDATLGEWQRLKAVELPKLNTRLGAVGQKPLVP